MLSVSPGVSTAYVTDPVSGVREGYYTNASEAASEPPGVWHGAGAEALGLRGEVDADLIEAVYSGVLDPRDPATHDRETWGEAQPLGAAHRQYRTADEMYATALAGQPDATPEQRADMRAAADRGAREATAYIDVTYSATKSVTVMGVAFERAANDAYRAGDVRAGDAWATHHRAVEDAVMVGARASLDYLQDRAGHARVGDHAGRGGRWVDAHGWTVAQFLQHDSRDHDPQLHVHNLVGNRALCSDGVWRALDGKALYLHKAAASAVGERATEAYLAMTLGARSETRPDGKSREVVGVDAEATDLFSSRRRAVVGKASDLLVAFREKWDREPNLLEHDRLQRQATLATRKAKSHDHETTSEQLERWDRELQAKLDGGLGAVAQNVVDKAQGRVPADKWNERDVIERALAAVGEGRQAWTRSDLMFRVSAALPGNPGVAPGAVRPFLDRLTDKALAEAVPLSPVRNTADDPESLKLASGESVMFRPGDEKYATKGQLAAEWALRDAAVARGAYRFTEADAQREVDRFARNGRPLGEDQAAAMRGVLTSGAMIESLNAPAGTGKSFTTGAVAGAWRESGRSVFGLATSQIASQVLADEGLTTSNVAAWVGHQERLDARPDPTDEWRLRRDDLVVLDEAGMTNTEDLAEVQRRCDAAGAKLLLVGDPRQLASVGAGGGLTDLSVHGIRYDLAEVRRFSEAWEGAASLNLRDGDASALAEYDQHGRLVPGGTVEQAEQAAARAYLADTLAGRDALLTVATNEAAARVSGQIRAERVRLGEVPETGVPIAGPNVAGVGDEVQARRNAWDLADAPGNVAAPVNRENYRVQEIHADGSLTLAPIVARVDGVDELGAPMTVPADYARESVCLGYASTVHASQGRTVDTAHSVIGAGGDAAGAYVALTRGRDRNTAYAVTVQAPPDAATGEVHDTPARSARAVVGDALDRADDQVSALATREDEHTREASSATVLGRLFGVVDRETAGRTEAALDRLATDGVLPESTRVALAADDATGSLTRLLRTTELAGHDPDAVLEAAVTQRGLDSARSPAQVLHHRITTTLQGDLTPTVRDAADFIPSDSRIGEPERAWMERQAGAADDRRRELGAEVAAERPEWALDALGEPPDDVIERAEWEHRAGWAASFRETVEHDDPADALGAAPAAGEVEKRALHASAHEQLGLPDRDAEEANLTDGQLRCRVAAFERERLWAPRYVGDELGEANRQAATREADATLWTAHANQATDAAERDALRADAAGAWIEAGSLRERITELELVDNARSAWVVETAKTADLYDRSTAELAARGVDRDAEPLVTADEWMAEHELEQRDSEPARDVTEADVSDDMEETTVDESTDDAGQELDVPDHMTEGDTFNTIEDDHADGSTLETDVPDIRDTATPDDTDAVDAERGHVPDVDETSDAVGRAQDALGEITRRWERPVGRECDYVGDIDDTRDADREAAGDSGSDDVWDAGSSDTSDSGSSDTYDADDDYYDAGSSDDSVGDDSYSDSGDDSYSDSGSDMADDDAMVDAR